MAGTDQPAAWRLPSARGYVYQRPLVEVPAEQSVPARLAKIKPGKDAAGRIAALSNRRGRGPAQICSSLAGAEGERGCLYQR
jgi:hypothetical protein